MASVGIRNRIYYRLRPYIPRRVQVWLRSRLARRKRSSGVDDWPIMERAATPPPGWPGWPHPYKFAFVLAHDVETAAGQSRCHRLMQLEQELGFVSSFNFVPERYRVLPDLRAMLTANGFEVGVHGLLHDGRLFESRRLFLARAERINHYLGEWQAVGFVSPSSHHHLEWMHDLHIEYDSSTFDTDPFEPQSDGLETIFPMWVEGQRPDARYVELPYTLPQDYTLMVLLGEPNTDIWKQKLRWIAEKGGLVFLIAHPDYMSFDGRPSFQEYPADLYREFLMHVRAEYAGQYWQPLPKQVAAYYRAHVLNGQPTAAIPLHGERVLAGTPPESLSR